MTFDDWDWEPLPPERSGGGELALIVIVTVFVLFLAFC